MDPSPGAVAVAPARNISGGVNPSVKLPAAPQPFRLEGPLEPPVGGHFHLIARSRELAYNRTFTTVNIPSSRASAFWNVCAVALALGRSVCVACQCWKRSRSSSSIHGPIQQDPIRYWYKHCAFSYAKEVVIITDEPALVAEPGWLQSLRLAP